MSTFIWPTNFISNVIIDKKIIPNNYSLQVCMEPLESRSKISLGFKKLKYFVDYHLHNSILIDINNTKLDVVKNFDNNIIEFPAEPWDYVIGIILLKKFNQIANKYLIIHYMTIDSVMGENVKYNIHDELDLDMELEPDCWWDKDSPSTNSKNLSWEDFNIKDSGNFKPRIIQGGIQP